MDSRVLILNLPSPPGQRLWRDTAGGFGTSLSCPPGYQPRNETPLHPFLPYAASVLKQAGTEFKLLDCQRLKLNNDQVIEHVETINPDIVFSIISLPSMRNDLKILDKIKESLPNVTTVGVGTACRVIPDEILSTSKLSLLLRNSYPYINGMVEIIQAIQKSKSLKNVAGVSYIKNENFIHTPEAPEISVENLPNPDYDSVPLDGYDIYTDSSGRRFPYVLILESKGCPYGCVYCPYPLGYGRKLTYRSATTIVDEIEHLHHVRGVDVFAFKGQTFAYNKKHSVEICDEIIRRNLDITWFCESRVDEINRNLLEKMREAGCRRLHFGVETGNIETLKIAKPGVTIGTTRRAFSLTKAYGFIRQAHVILGWPEDTHKTLKDTHRFIMEIKPDVLNLNFLTPYPGTKIYEIARKNGLLLTNDWSNFTSHKVVMRTKSLSAAQLYTIRTQIVRDFSIQKLQALLLNFDAQNIARPWLLFYEAKKLMNKILFPALD